MTPLIASASRLAWAVLPWAALAFAWVALAWQTIHFIQWTADLSAAIGDGSAASMLRIHAYTYAEHVFGETFGWRLGGSA